MAIRGDRIGCDGGGTAGTGATVAGPDFRVAVAFFKRRKVYHAAAPRHRSRPTVGWLDCGALPH